MKTKYIIITFFLFFAKTVSAQNKVFIETKDTTFLNIYKGRISYNYSIVDGEKVLNGKITFQSDLYENIRENKLNKFKFQGTYKNNLKDGLWSYTETKYDVKLKDVIEKNQFNIEYDLSGVEYKVNLFFKNGIPDGNWTINKSFIENKRRKPQKNSGNLPFKNGVIKGHF
jgi:hypothetical protein